MADLSQDSRPLHMRAPARIWRFIRKRASGWRARHQHPFNFAVHLIGIPLAVAGIVFLFQAQWVWGIVGLVIGYLLQFIGHRVEGNDVGEWALLKRLLGLPYVAISPRWQSGSQFSQSPPHIS